MNTATTMTSNCATKSEANFLKKLHRQNI